MPTYTSTPAPINSWPRPWAGINPYVMEVPASNAMIEPWVMPEKSPRYGS